MKRFLKPVACAAAILLSSVAVEAIASPAFAQTDDQVDFQTFHDELASYGDWVYSDRWGEVWIPTDVASDFQPYGSDGYWAYSDYGWTWVSGYDWGDIPFHYGRWVNDPDDGWLWIPGYVWSPAWVVWRSNGRYVGWMAMPPDEVFLGRSGPSLGISLGGGLNFSINFGSTRGYYGYSQWYGRGYDANRFASNWVFVDEGHMADRNFSRYRAPRSSYASLISHGKDVTHYSVSNNYVVNRSIDPRAVQKAGGHAVPVVHISQIIKRPQFVTTANQGQQIQSRMRSQNPRGTGIANSAPRPSDQVVQSLSTQIKPHNGRSTTHLFTRDTVTSAPLPSKPAGAFGQPGNVTPAPQPGTGPMHDRQLGPNGMTQPSSQNPATSTPVTPTPGFTHRRDNATNPANANGPTAPTATQPLQNQNVTPSTPNGQAPSTPGASPFSDRMHRHDNQTATPPPGSPTTPQSGPRNPFAPSTNNTGSTTTPSGGANVQGNPPPSRFERTVPTPQATGGPAQTGGASGNQSQPNGSAHNDHMRVVPTVPTVPTTPVPTPPVATPPPTPKATLPPPPAPVQDKPAGKPDKKKPDDGQPQQ